MKPTATTSQEDNYQKELMAQIRRISERNRQELPKWDPSLPDDENEDRLDAAMLKLAARDYQAKLKQEQKQEQKQD